MKSESWPLKRTVLEIRWDDNAGGHGWTKPASYLADPCSKCISVGYLLYEDAKMVKLVQSMDGSFGNVDAGVFILKKNITSRRRLC